MHPLLEIAAKKAVAESEKRFKLDDIRNLIKKLNIFEIPDDRQTKYRSLM